MQVRSSRVVVGGGLFGAFAALVLSEYGHQVTVIEQDAALLQRASYVNQARLHTGLHYPRSLLTAQDALNNFRGFIDRFPEAVRHFEQIYAVSRFGSKTSDWDFASFVARLGGDAERVDPTEWFHPGTVSAAYRVTEPSFDASVLRARLASELQENDRITVKYGAPVVSGRATAAGVEFRLRDGQMVAADAAVLCTYAGTNAVRAMLGLPPLALTYELTEVVLGRVDEALAGLGFTVMDGPFWSLMPFGQGNQVSLTSVGLTPLMRNARAPAFPCQERRNDCSPDHLAECTSCPVRPASAVEHQRQQMGLFLKEAEAFTPERSLMTVKTVLSASEVDDARPTIVSREADVPVWTVLSGKVSTLLDLEEALE